MQNLIQWSVIKFGNSLVANNDIYSYFQSVSNWQFNYYFKIKLIDQIKSNGDKQIVFMIVGHIKISILRCEIEIILSRLRVGVVKSRREMGLQTFWSN